MSQSQPNTEFWLLVWGVGWVFLIWLLARRSRSRTVSIGGGFVLSFFLMGILAVLFAPKQPERGSKPDQPARRAMTVSNSGWDGSVWQVERWLERHLKDPDSFEAIEWGSVIQVEDGYTVRLRYRAKNSFGGFDISDQLFILDRTGQVVTAFE